MRSLIRGGLLGVVWVSVALAIAGFFLPWATVDVRVRKLTGQVGQAIQGTPLQELADQLTKKVGRVVIKVKHGAETVTGELPDLAKIPSHVSGFDVPQLANRQDAKVVLALGEMLTGQQELGAKSYAVWLLPALALLCGLLITLSAQAPPACLVTGLACLAVAGGGFWKLLTAKTETLMVAIVIGRGLWLSLWAYVGLGLSALLLTVFGRPNRAH